MRVVLVILSAWGGTVTLPMDDMEACRQALKQISTNANSRVYCIAGARP